MLFVVNKEKILSFFIAFSIIAIIMCFSVFITNNELIETSTNAEININKDSNNINKE